MEPRRDGMVPSERLPGISYTNITMLKLWDLLERKKLFNPADVQKGRRARCVDPSRCGRRQSLP